MAEMSDIHDDEITEELDGTFSVNVWFWDRKITGLPTKKVAREVCQAISESFDKGSEMAQTD